MFLRFGFWIAVSAVFLLASTLPLQAGNATQGADIHAEGDNVWFLGDKPVEYCIRKSDALLGDKKYFSTIVRESIEEWISFFRKYDLVDRKFTDLHDNQPRGLDFNFVEVPNCLGGSDQLQFLFGMSDPLISDALQFTEGSLGLSMRRPYNHQSYRNEGTIWIGKFLFSEPTMRHMILHELGHIFGMAHDSVHVMNSYAASQVLNVAEYRRGLGKIEVPTFLYRMRPGDEVDYAFDGDGFDSEGKRYEPNALLEELAGIIGFDPNDFHQLVLKYESKNPADGSSNLSLRFTEKSTRKSVIFKGTFKARTSPPPIPGARDLDRGPSLYTRFHCPECPSEGKVMLQHLDRDSSVAPMEGSFEYLGRIYPAVLERARGFGLRIFLPELQKWWNVDRYRSARFFAGF